MNRIFISATKAEGESAQESIEIPESLSTLSAEQIKNLIIGAIQEVK